MTKEQKLIHALTETLGYVVVDGNLALDDIWDRGDDGFRDQIDMVGTVLDKVKEYDEKLFNKALENPREFVKNIERDDEEEELDYV